MEEITYSFFDLGFGAYFSNLTACIVIAMLIMTLFRILLRNKFKSSWTYAMWIILPLCFLIPLKLELPFTLIEIPSFNFAVNIEPIEPILYDGITEIPRYATLAETDGLLLYSILKWIWAAGFLAAVSIEIIRYVRLNNDIRKNYTDCSSEMYNAVLKNICAELKLRSPQLMIYSKSDTPFAMGIIKPKILLPSCNYSEEEIEFILRHEATHIKRHDIPVKIMLTIFRCINWFNPLAYIICRQAFEDIEITCDETATEKFSHEQRCRYSSALLKSVSNRKYAAATTYLSSDARSLKKRISAVMAVKKLGGIIPFTVVFIVVIFLSSIVSAAPDQPHTFYIFTSPYPTESDPYITTDEWKSCTAENAEEAAEKIFRQYMNMYMGNDIPEYYKINNYYVTDIYEIKGMEKGLLNRSKFVSLSYNAEFANECGNTVHNKNFGISYPVNGIAIRSRIDYELENIGNTWTLVNYGTAATFGFCQYHFENTLTGSRDTLETVQLMAESGLLDYSWNTSDNLPDAEDYIKWKHLHNQKCGITENVFINEAQMPFGTILRDNSFIEAIKNSEHLNDEMQIVGTDKLDFQKAEAIYCGYDFDVVTGSVTAYFNIAGEKTHGAALTFTQTTGITPRLVSVAVTKSLYKPYIFSDSFLTAALPDDLTEHATPENAEAILKYMSVPRSGSDFTVLDYRDITETSDGIFADVKFKGRLEGVYSSDIIDVLDNTPIYSEYIPEDAYDGYFKVCIIK